MRNFHELFIVTCHIMVPDCRDFDKDSKSILCTIKHKSIFVAKISN